MTGARMISSPIGSTRTALPRMGASGLQVCIYINKRSPPPQSRIHTMGNSFANQRKTGAQIPGVVYACRETDEKTFTLTAVSHLHPKMWK